MNIRVMLADDHILMREGIRQLLECDNSIEVVGEVSNGEQCMQMIYKVKPQVLLLDINMPVKNGIEVLKEIRHNKLGVKVLILT
ncbi:MAG: response regulator transcription factor, partial [Lachnospiraceae bacterium]|nr:response regulator transcription factor [Lachnospiraceae bacterium]